MAHTQTNGIGASTHTRTRARALSKEMGAGRGGATTATTICSKNEYDNAIKLSN